MGPKLVVKLLFDHRDPLAVSSLIQIPKEVIGEEIAACQRGEVVGIGPDAFEHWHQDNLIQLGDVVLLKRYSGTNRQYGDHVFRSIEDRDIWGVEDSNVIERLLNE